MKKVLLTLIALGTLIAPLMAFGPFGNCAVGSPRQFFFTDASTCMMMIINNQDGGCWLGDDWDGSYPACD